MYNVKLWQTLIFKRVHTSREEHLLASSCPTIHPPVHMYQLGTY
jgi:hypothetical protein